MVELVCESCGSEISRPPSLVKGRKHHFCNLNCLGQWRSKHCRGEAHHQYTSKKVNCSYCGKMIERPPYRLKLNKLQFCDLRCRGKHDSEHKTGKNHPHWNEESHVVLTCKWCGQEYKEKIQRKDRSNFCSKACHYSWVRKNWRGKIHPLWKGGFVPYYGKNWPEERNKALERDRYVCQACFKHKEELDCSLVVHHKIPLRRFKKPEDANFQENLITLCRKDHNKIDHEVIAL